MRPLNRSVAALVFALSALAITGTPALADPPEGTIRATGAARSVPDSYVVVLAPDVDATAVAHRYGGTVARTFTHAMHGFELHATETVARRLAADPRVRYVQRNGIMHLDNIPNSGTQTNPPSWGLDRIDQTSTQLNNTFAYGSMGRGVHAYIIDSGIWLTHTEFGGRAVSGWDVTTNSADATDCYGHGTHVAGTVGGGTTGVAKAVILVAVKIADCQGNLTSASVIAGVEWVTANAIKPAVANMSLSGTGDTAIDTAVQNSINSGVTYVVAAGNDNTNACQKSPARVGWAITVGATDAADTRATYSNYGSCVKIFAPGDGITSAWLGNDSYRTLSGTSMATPHVTGVVAWILARHPDYTTTQVYQSLLNDYTTRGNVVNAGSGSYNTFLYARYTEIIWVGLGCSANGDSTFNCGASAMEGTAPYTVNWSYHNYLYQNQWGFDSAFCAPNSNLTITVTITDAHGISGTASTPVHCVGGGGGGGGGGGPL